MIVTARAAGSAVDVVRRGPSVRNVLECGFFVQLWFVLRLRLVQFGHFWRYSNCFEHLVVWSFCLN